jgi:hypothetical protein
MTLTLPPFNSIVNSGNKKTKKIYQNNIAYNPIYNEIYDLEPKIVKKNEIMNEMVIKDIFDLNLITIFQNISNVLLLIIIDLTNITNYSNLRIFLKIFLKDNRLIYLGLFIIFISIIMILFK